MKKPPTTGFENETSGFKALLLTHLSSIFKKKYFLSEKTATTGFEPETSGFKALLLTHSATRRCNTPEDESYQVFKCRTTQHKEIKSNLTRDLTLTFDGSLAPRAPNPNVHHEIKSPIQIPCCIDNASIYSNRTVKYPNRAINLKLTCY